MQQGHPPDWEPPPAPWVPPPPPEPTPFPFRAVAIAGGIAVVVVVALAIVAALASAESTERPVASVAMNATDIAAEIFAGRGQRFHGKRVAIYGHVNHVEATKWGPRVVFETRRTKIRAYLRRSEREPPASRAVRYSVNCLATLQSDGFVFDDCFAVP